MSRKLNSLTVVAPFFNEEMGAQRFYEVLCQHLDSLNIPYNLVFVDDGSADRTLHILNRIADGDSRVTVLSLARNFGHQTAITAGLDYADGEAVVVMDSDLQHPPSAIAEMVREYEAGAEVVYGVRRNANNGGWLKQWVSKNYYRVFEGATNVKIVRNAADFRLTSQKVLDTLREMREVHRYLRGMVPWIGFPHSVVQYDQAKRELGVPGYTWRKSFRLARHGLFSFSTIPLDFITWMGIVVTILGMIYLVYILYVTLILGTALPGWASLIVVMLVVSGVQLISIGIIAQYIGMIFEQVKGRPLYVLKQARRQSAFKHEEKVGTGLDLSM